MSLTAYSHTFKRELQVSQLRELFEKSTPPIEGDFKDFVRTDIECSSCLARGAMAVREGKDLNGRTVKQEHFAFRDSSGGDPHQKYCDHYSGTDKIKSLDNEALIDLRKSNSPITHQIKIMVCIGIENNIFSQQDIRDMREWYISIRTNNTTSFNISHHLINIANSAFWLNFSKPDLNGYTDNRSLAIKSNFNLDDEVYKSLVFKNPQYRFNNIPAQDKILLSNVRLADVRKKAISIIKVNNGLFSFDRLELTPKMRLSLKLANEIREFNGAIKKSISRSTTYRNNPTMALASLLLFSSDWNYDLASEKLHKIIKINKANDLTAGNVIGLNPFINYSAWAVVQTLSRIKTNSNDETDYDAAFNNERERLKKVFAISE